MIDTAALLVDQLNQDPNVAASLPGGIYAYRIPPDATPPLALVLVPGNFPAAAPTIEWWQSMATIDIHAESPAVSNNIADRITQVVTNIVGSYNQAVVADCQVTSVASIVDGAWTPTRYRQVVTVDLTARRTFEGG